MVTGHMHNDVKGEKAMVSCLLYWDSGCKDGDIKSGTWLRMCVFRFSRHSILFFLHIKIKHLYYTF